MARLVRDKATGEMKSSDELYRVEETLASGKKRVEYYTNEEAYIECSKRARYRRLCTDKIGELFGYFDGEKFPKEILRDLDFLGGTYGYEELYRTICFAYNDIKYAFDTKVFGNAYNKSRYAIGIIQNKIDEISKRVQKYKQVAQAVNEDDLVVTEIKRKDEPIKKGISFLLGDDE